MNLEVGKSILVYQAASHFVVAGDETARITHVREGDSHPELPNHSLCSIEWVNRPLRHQMNGSFRPFTQVWVPNDIQTIDAA